MKLKKIEMRTTNYFSNVITNLGKSILPSRCNTEIKFCMLNDFANKKFENYLNISSIITNLSQRNLH